MLRFGKVDEVHTHLMSRVSHLYHEMEDATLSCPLIRNLFATKVLNCKYRTFGASGFFFGCCVMASPKFETRTVNSRDVKCLATLRLFATC
jgi:hypothetical protein